MELRIKSKHSSSGKRRILLAQLLHATLYLFRVLGNIKSHFFNYLCYLKSATVNLRSNCGMYDVYAFESYRSGFGLESPRPCGLH